MSFSCRLEKAERSRQKAELQCVEIENKNKNLESRLASAQGDLTKVGAHRPQRTFRVRIEMDLRLSLGSARCPRTGRDVPKCEPSKPRLSGEGEQADRCQYETSKSTERIGREAQT